jgi:hypothetical protein
MQRQRVRSRRELHPQDATSSGFGNDGSGREGGQDSVPELGHLLGEPAPELTEVPVVSP